ncbi:unnamed protein product [Bursaphelenchus okinawaensis]|uniref:CAS family C-terminal domain-containing protein n=1 Tax=Bursaphelenchus okinawaensis TaxID=465554 RepID=A0A811JTQ7_9BILA|nr:unnamed protein product [Bursaphelenchus okinawaensis]CAG9082056.1 unnamed protein product [Bursaphelenchus okinawaensis]
MNNDGSTADLSNQVGQLFMMDSDFFHSPFMRDKIPKILFSNGMRGLESSTLKLPTFNHAFSMNDVSSKAVVKDIPIRVKTLASNPTFTEISSVRNSTPTPSFHSTRITNRTPTEFESVPNLAQDFKDKHDIRRTNDYSSPSYADRSNNYQPKSSISSNNYLPPPFVPSSTYHPPMSKPSNTFQTTTTKSSDSYQPTVTVSSNTYQPKVTMSFTSYQPSVTMSSNSYQPSRAISPKTFERTDNHGSLRNLSSQFGVASQLYNSESSSKPVYSSYRDLPTSEDNKFGNSYPSGDLNSYRSFGRRSETPPLTQSRSRTPVITSTTPHNYTRDVYNSLPRLVPTRLESSTATLPPLIRPSRERKINISDVRNLPRPAESGPAKPTRSVERSTNDFGLFPSSSLQSLRSLHRDVRTDPPSAFYRTNPPNVRETSFSSRTTSNPDLYTKSLTRPLKSPDLVDEAIRSLESFDPNEYLTNGLSTSYSVSSPGLTKELEISANDATVNILSSERMSLQSLIGELRSQCLGFNELTSKPGWRSYGELDYKLPEIKQLFYSIRGNLAKLQSRLVTDRVNASSDLMDTVAIMMTEFNHISGNADDWSTRRLWRGAWASETNDDLDKFTRLSRRLLNVMDELTSVTDRTLRSPHSPTTRSVKTEERLTPNGFMSSPNTYNNTNFLSSSPLMNSSYSKNFEVMDGGESTTSSTTSFSPTISQKSVTESKDTLIPQSGYLPPDSPESRIVMEEDDLASLSSSMNFGKISPPPPIFDRSQLDGQLSSTELEMVEFCAPQVTQNNEKLNRLVEAFYNEIETGESPEKFGQKARMIVMVGKVLTQLAKNIGSSLQSPSHKMEFEKTGDLLEKTVDYCQESINEALKQYPQVPAIESLITVINSICQQTQNLCILVALSMYQSK